MTEPPAKTASPAPSATVVLQALSDPADQAVLQQAASLAGSFGRVGGLVVGIAGIIWTVGYFSARA